jgi:hypothetical protein
VCAGGCCRCSRGALRADARCPRRFIDGTLPVGDGCSSANSSHIRPLSFAGHL